MPQQSRPATKVTKLTKPPRTADPTTNPTTKPGKPGKPGKPAKPVKPADTGRPGKLSRETYEAELLRLQAELVVVQEWVKATGQRIVVVFEGRDAAGKGSTIKRVTEYLNPRVARIMALPMPTERERSQWYFQRYAAHLPARGEIVLMDRSWYNRAGVERVMGYCTPEEYRRFLHQCPTFERMLVEDGVLLLKYWFSVSDDEQERRFTSRLEDPLRQWKFSANDLLTRDRWVDFSRAKDEMFVHTDIPEAPWYVVEADVKRHARLNMISHLLSALPYHQVELPAVVLTPRPPAQDYQRPPRELFHAVPDHAGELLARGGRP
jgi:polyphosphate kinase